MRKEINGAGAGTPEAPKHRDTVIIPEQERNYIDTLYLSTNLQDHYPEEIMGAEIAEHLRYQIQRRSFEGLRLHGAKKLADASGYEWYQLENYRVGLMEYEKAKRANLPNCVIQYSHDHIFPLDQQLDGLDLPFSQDRNLYQIKRIDITKTARLDTDYTKYYGYISPFRSDPLCPARHENTVYLGSRRNGNVFRMYNKTLELMQTQNYEKIALYSQYFDTIKDLYTFEHELHRKYLKAELGIDTLAELDRVWTASQSITSKIRIFPITDSNQRKVKNKHYERIEAMRLTKFVEYKRPEKKKYARSYDAMVQRMRKELSAYLKCSEGQQEQIPLLAGKLLFDLFGDDLADKEIEILITETTRTLQMQEMRKKHKLMREKQTDDLYLEAEARFGPLPTKR